MAAQGNLLVNINIPTVEPEITVANVTGNVGDYVDVPISITDNPGIITMRLNIEYDGAALRLVNVVDNGVLGAQYHSDNYASPYTLFWENGTARENICYNGKIATLRFEILAATNYSPVSVS